MIPAWQPPNLADLPDIRQADAIALDIETKDPGLKERGSGALRKDGYIVGVSLATKDFRCYLPIRHEGGDNVDAEKALLYVRDMLSTDVPKVGANLPYDLEWLKVAENIDVAGPKYDVQVAEPLLNEDRDTYKLDALAESYLSRHKDEALLEEYAASIGIAKDDIKANLWRFPGRIVGQYGETDSVLPLDIFAIQRPLLDKEDLWPVFQLESKLVDIMLKIKIKGTAINIERAYEVKERLSKEFLVANDKLRNLAHSSDFDIWSNQSIAAACDRQGISYLTTAKGNPSFTGGWLESQPQELFQLIKRARKLDRMGSVFVQSKIIDLAINGRIHPSFWSVRNDDYGTRGGRYSSSNPNMQQVPSRDPEMAPLIRSIFVPEKGCKWNSFDHKQQEPRLTVHYAYISSMPGAQEAWQRYQDNPDTDYHTMVSEMADCPRDKAKTINLGLAYGMGKDKLAKELDLNAADSLDLMTRYHASVPYVKSLGDRCSQLAKQRGYIKTHLGRRKHFNYWGPYRWSKDTEPMMRADAITAYGPNVVRYYTHKALNSLIQGSAADMIKQNIVDCHDAGYLPTLTVHDELCFVDLQNDKQAVEVRKIMENAFKLSVPLGVDIKQGETSWGDAKKVKL